MFKPYAILIFLPKCRISGHPQAKSSNLPSLPLTGFLTLAGKPKMNYIITVRDKKYLNIMFDN